MGLQSMERRASTNSYKILHSKIWNVSVSLTHPTNKVYVQMEILIKISSDTLPWALKKIKGTENTQIQRLHRKEGNDQSHVGFHCFSLGERMSERNGYLIPTTTSKSLSNALLRNF